MQLQDFEFNQKQIKHFEAGMNDFISKPFTEGTLTSSIAKWLEEKNSQPKINPETVPTSNASPEKLYSLAYFEEIARGDTDFIKKMVTMFVELTPDLVVQMLKAYESKDLTEMSRLAHKVKPSIDNMGISSLHAAIREIERAGKAGEDSVSLITLQQEVKTVIDKVINQLKKEYLFS